MIYTNEINLEEFDNMPFIDQNFKDLPEIRKKLEYGNCHIYISPKINRIYEKSFSEICMFFEDKIHLFYLDTNEGINENNFLNYFEWFFTKNKIPTSLDTLLNIKEILSPKILKDKSFLKKRILKENLPFPKYEEIYFSMKESLQREKLNCNEIMLILKKLQLMEEDNKNKKEREEILNYYFTLCCELAEIKLTPVFEGFLLDSNKNFRRINQLYYITDPIIESFIGNSLKEKYFLLKVPKENKKNFLNFCSKNELKIYENGTVKFTHIEKSQNRELEDEIKGIKNYIYQLIEIHSTTAKDPNHIYQKIDKIKFFQCKNIIIETTWKDSFEHAICYSENTNKIINLYFLQDDTYTTWKHPSIMYYLAWELAKILECEKLHASIITLLSLGTEYEIKKWLRLEKNINLF